MKILENNKSHLDDFIRLNEEWISHYFELEQADRTLAADPYAIVRNGGFIFSLTLEEADSNNEVIGVCALFNDGDGVYELARMAVSPRYHGGGYANQLMDAAFKKLNMINAKKVYLISNTKLASAINLYKKYQFETIMEGPHPKYSRADIVMERVLD